jgi:transglutaminase-like putative cysteine protease
MFYSIRHVTKFRYSAPISESVMEVRMQPRSEVNQRGLSFALSLNPRARLTSYRDHLGNVVHHFDIPGRHNQLTIKATAIVEIAPLVLPDALDADAWEALDALVTDGDYLEMLMPSQFARPTEPLRELARELKLERRSDPLSVLRELNAQIHDGFDYAPQSTQVDSPIDEALSNRKGVCQDFAHIMTALVREMGIPCRYVSGYLFHRTENRDRSAQDATHAWIEALLPELGWVGFDPTNNLVASERHIRAAIGRDYADVPPTRGVFKGEAQTELSVAVQVSESDAPPPEEPALAATAVALIDTEEQQQQQQQ